MHAFLSCLKHFRRICMLLSQMEKRQHCLICKLNLEESLAHRLEALGMTEHSKLEVVNRKGKGTLIIKLRGSQYALGEDITENIEVEKI